MSKSRFKHVSLPEKIISHYLKQIFSDLEESYRASWLGHHEIDMFIPSLNLAIEYDGHYFHQDIERDLKKNALM